VLSAVLSPSIGWLRPTAPPRHQPIANDDKPVKPGLREKIDSFVTRRVAEDSFSGVVAVARNGTVMYERAAGIANRSRGTPMTLDTKLQIASITKIFTQVAILQLEQAGKLALTDTVGKFLPAYPNTTVRSKVTVDQLLHHRSGVGSFWNAEFMSRHASIHTVSDYMALFDRDSLLFQPGTADEYSNGGYVLLGAIIERVSGQSYHDYVRTHIFEPAGMTGTMPYDNRRSVANAAVGYTSQELERPLLGDSRHAGVGPLPGHAPANVPKPAIVQHPPAGAAGPATPAPGFRFKIVGPDGHELSPEEARKAVAELAAEGTARHPNTATEAGTSGPAGDDYSTAADFIRFARALVSRRLLDSPRTAAVLGTRYRAGGDFRIAGGAPGVNAEFSIFPSGYVVVVLSNYDPPAATTIAQFIRGLLGTPSSPNSP
jgi:CubicO group peptidase (beta-lactamase class C family)